MNGAAGFFVGFGLIAAVAGACGVQESAPFSTTAPGDAVITSSGDLAGITHLQGSLIIHPDAKGTAITLPLLAIVDGSVRVENLTGNLTGGFTLSLPALTSIGLDLQASQTGSAVTMDFPMLTAISGHLIIDQASPVSIDAAALKSIHGDIRATDGDVGTLDFPALTEIGGGISLLRFQGIGTDPVTLSLPALTTIATDIELSTGASTTLDFPLLTTAGNLDVVDVRVQLNLPQLASLGGELRLERATLAASDLTVLNNIGGDFVLDQVSLEGSDGILLQSLTRVGGELTIQDVSSLLTIDLPALTEVDTGVLIADDGQLTRVTFAGLAQAYSDVELSGCGGPVALELPALVHAGGSIIMADNGQASLSAPILSEITGSLEISGSTLSELDLPALAAVGQDISLEQVSALTPQSITLASLGSVGGDFRLDGTIGYGVLALPLLATIGSMPGGFPHGSLILDNNDSLSSMVVPALRSVIVDVDIEDNPILHGAAAAVAGVSVGGMTMICGNGDGEPACPAMLRAPAAGH